MRRKTLLAVLLLLVVVASSCRWSGRPAATQSPASVPAAYQELYDHLAAALDDDIALLSAARPVARHPVTFAAELITADANRGPALLQPETLPATALYLDRLQAIGVRGVKISVQYPLLTPSFPDYDRYLDFYRQVASEVRKRGMVLTVQASILFANTVFSEVRVDYSGLTFERYMAEDREMVATIVRELHPDYLVILGEPDTAANLSGLKEFLQPDRCVEMVSFVLQGLDRGATQVGAGTGSCSSLDYTLQLVTRTDIDFVSIHVYPVNKALIEAAVQMAALARENHKGVNISEAWLYKVAVPGGGDNVAASADIFRRDVYSFWAPLDCPFLEMLASLADVTQAELASVFWSPYLFGYLDYEPRLERLSYQELHQQANQAAYANLQAGRLSPAGVCYQQVIAGP